MAFTLHLLSTVESRSKQIGALNVNLSSDQIARLDTANVVPLGTPHEQINGSAPAIAGGKPELLGAPEIPAA